VDRPSHETTWRTTRVGGLRVFHDARVSAEDVSSAIELHRGNAARGPSACEQCGPASSVSRVRVGGHDWAVKWQHPRGGLRALADGLRGSRSRRALVAARWLGAAGLRVPAVVACAERRHLGCVPESFLVSEFEAGAEPLPLWVHRHREAAQERCALAQRLGEAVGRLHAAGLDQRDFKHSNLLVRADGALVFIDLDSVRHHRCLSERARVRALGQIEAYARDFYPWLPSTERAHFLRGYLDADAAFAERSAALVGGAARWAERRIREWARRDRSGHHPLPVDPRDEGP
jgi:tRNA A-37 threonylcarbamoyl transferase component Bud32